MCKLSFYVFDVHCLLQTQQGIFNACKTFLNVFAAGCVADANTVGFAKSTAGNRAYMGGFQ